MRLQAENVVSAIRDFSEAIRLKPDDVTAYSNRAIAYDAIGETGKDRSKAEQLKSVKTC